MSVCSVCYNLDGRNEPPRKNPHSQFRVGSARTPERDVLNFSVSLQTLEQRKVDGCPSCSMLFAGLRHYRECWLGVDEKDVSISVWKYSATPFNVSINKIEPLFGSEDKFSRMLVHLEFFCLEGHKCRWPAFTTLAPIPEKPLGEQTKTSVMKWIRECDSNHLACASTKSPLPKRVLDLGKRNSTNRLALYESKGERVPYITLSHCWGGAQPLTSTKSTLVIRKQGISFNELPQTFQDAVKVCRWLEIRYLWIDSLCIVQDDVEDWQSQSAQMADIYAGSYLTISASTASDSSSGFLSNREKPKGIAYVDDDSSSQVIYVRKAISHVQLFNLTTPTEARDRYPVYPRAWCFQERLLARRILHFLSSELVFECCSSHRCECERIAQEHGAPLKRDFMAATSSHIDLSQFQLSSKHSPQQVWRDLVKQYSEKQLTYSRDKLAALSGIASRMPPAAVGSYIAGIWEHHIPEGLVWYVPSYINTQWRRYPSYVAPSFSWASVDGPILWSDTYSAIRSLAPTFKVLEARCDAKGIDPTGEVSSGFIKVRGALVTATVLKREDDRVCVEKSGSREKLSLDIADDFAALEGQSISCLWIFSVSETVIALALKDSSAFAGAYERVGLIKRAPASWFSGVGDTAVTMV